MSPTRTGEVATASGATASAGPKTRCVRYDTPPGGCGVVPRGTGDDGGVRFGFVRVVAMRGVYRPDRPRASSTARHFPSRSFFAIARWFSRVGSVADANVRTASFFDSFAAFWNRATSFSWSSTMQAR